MLLLPDGKRSCLNHEAAALLPPPPLSHNLFSMSLSLAFLTARFLFLFFYDSFPHPPGYCLQFSTFLAWLFVTASGWLVLPLACAFVSLLRRYGSISGSFFFFLSPQTSPTVAWSESAAGLPNTVRCSHLACRAGLSLPGFTSEGHTCLCGLV